MPHRFAVAQAADWLAVHLDVGDDVDFWQPLNETAAGLLNRRPVEITQPATKCYQLMVAQRLVAEKQHQMVAPSLHDARERDVFQVLKIDAFHRGAQRCAGRSYVGWAAADAARHFGLSAQSHRKPPSHRAASLPNLRTRISE